MSLWDSIKKVVNGEYEMKSFYDRKCMYEVRVKYATWIENRLKDISSERTETVCSQFHIDLIEHIKASAEYGNELSLMIKSIEIVTPIELYVHFMDGIVKELLLIERNSYQMKQLPFIQQIIKSCNEFHQIISNQYNEPGTIKSINNPYDPVDFLTKTLQDLEIKQICVFEELKNWQREQIRMCSMDEDEKKKFNVLQADKLNKIQDCIELLFKITCKLLELIGEFKNQGQATTEEERQFDSFALKIRRIQKSIIEESFVVEDQPQQVIKTLENFSVSVRWLIGQQLQSNNGILNVECTITSDRINKYSQLAHDLENTTKLQGNEEQLQYQEESRVYSAHFKSLQITRFERAANFNEQVALLFRMTVNTNDFNNYNILTQSIPLVVILHENQEHQAWANIIWNNAIWEVGQIQLQIPERVSWTKVSEALYSKCFSETKRGFTDGNRRFFYEKLCPNMTQALPDEEISWETFCKNSMSGVYYTFWEWFYFAIKLIKDHLLTPWRQNLIDGFISRSEAIRRLENCRPGTFLLRFSESFVGAITISYVNNYNQVDHIQPYTARDLQYHCLADRIKECVSIRELYPYRVEKSKLYYEFGGQGVRSGTNGYVSGRTLTFMDKK